MSGVSGPLTQPVVTTKTTIRLSVFGAPLEAKIALLASRRSLRTWPLSHLVECFVDILQDLAAG